MIHILKSFAARVWAGIALLVVLGAVLLVAVRVLLPLAAEYREQLARELSAAVGAPVAIERLGARLAGLAPELKLVGVEVRDPTDGTVQLRFRELRLRLDLTGTLRSGEPQVALVTLVGARVALRREEDGRLALAGLNAAGADEGSDISPAPLLSQGRLRIRDSEVLWENRQLGLAPIRLANVEAELSNAGDRHRLELRGDLSQDPDGHQELRADFTGAPESPGDWRGEVYLRGRGLPLGVLARELGPTDTLIEATAGLELWTRWTGPRMDEADGWLELRDLRTITQAGARGGEGSEWLTAPRLAARLAWRREAAGGWLGLRDLVLERQAGGGTPTDLELRLAWRGDGTLGVQASADRLDLEDLTAIALTTPLPPAGRRALAQTRPRGLLLDARLELALPADDGPPRWSARGRLDGVTLEPWESAPGIRGLALDFQAEPDRGRLDLDTGVGEVVFPGMFRGPLPLRRLTGALAWRLDPDDGLHLGSAALRAENRHIATRSRLYLHLPPGDGQAFIDLQTDYSDADGTAVGLYLPSGILSAETLEWLDRALVGGEVPSGSFVLRGPLDAFPFRGREGRFQVLFGVEDIILDYQEGWPRLEEIHAEVEFLDEGLDIRVEEARLLESRVQDTRAWVPDLDVIRSVRVTGRVDGPFADGFRILRETPLADSHAAYVAGMEAVGDSRLDLDLHVPVADDEPGRVDGTIHWDGAGLELPDFGITLERLKGRLRLTQDGIAAQGLQARLWGQPLRADIGTRPDSPGAHIGVDLPLDVKRLAARFPHSLWAALDGSAPGRLDLDVAYGKGGKRTLGYRLGSDLEGIRVDLPAPLGKPGDAPRPLSIAGTLPAAPGGRVEGAYGDIAGALVLGQGPDGLAPERGHITCGTNEPPADVDAGFLLDGRLDTLDLAGWAARAQGAALPEGPKRTPALSDARLKLAIGELPLPWDTLTDVRLAATRVPGAWEAEIRSEGLSGDIRVPDAPREDPITATIPRLRLDPARWDSEAPAPPEPPPEPSRLDPRTAPGLRIEIEDLVLGEHSFGRLELQAEPIPQGLALTRIALDGPLLDLEATGAWIAGARRRETHVRIEGTSPDLGEALRRLDFTSALGGADMRMEADLGWAGAPQDVRLANLGGRLEFHVGEGRVLDVNPGVGRLFGLFNLGALNRRLTLDFSDLFGKGYAFDRIDGLFTLGDGQAQVEELVIEGPSARVDISGRTGLVTRDYDQTVTVTPELSTALPLAGALAGGPLGAAAMLIAEQIMGKEFNKLIRYRYRVTGPWDEPLFEPIQTQDGWSLSNLLRPAEKPPEGATPEKQEKKRPAPGMFVH